MFKFNLKEKKKTVRWFVTRFNLFMSRESLPRRILRVAFPILMLTGVMLYIGHIQAKEQALLSEPNKCTFGYPVQLVSFSASSDKSTVDKVEIKFTPTNGWKKSYFIYSTEISRENLLSMAEQKKTICIIHNTGSREYGPIMILWPK